MTPDPKFVSLVLASLLYPDRPLYSRQEEKEDGEDGEPEEQGRCTVN